MVVDKMNVTKENFYKCLGLKIMEIRVKKHLTREHLAEVSDISPKYLYEIEKGNKGCSVFVLYCIAKSLNSNMDIFLSDITEVENEIWLCL